MALVDLADNVHHFRDAGLRAALVDDGEVGVKASCQRAGADHTADIRRNDHQLRALVAGADVLDKHGGGEQIVGRDVEESLNLAGVKINGQHPVGACRGDQIGKQLGGNRRARPRFAVLARIAVIGKHRGDPAGRAAAQRVERDKQLHHIVVRGKAGGLDDEHILATHILADFDKHFHIGEAADICLSEGNVKIGCNRLGKRAIAVTGENFHPRPS